MKGYVYRQHLYTVTFHYNFAAESFQASRGLSAELLVQHIVQIQNAYCAEIRVR